MKFAKFALDFIDIIGIIVINASILLFRRYKISKNNCFYKVCPYCNTEVKLHDEFKAQPCPKCGSEINLCKPDAFQETYGEVTK